MAWSFVGTSATVENTATPLTLTEPAGVADGDLLIATISSRSTATTAPTATGWTAVGSQNNNNILSTGSAIASGVMLYQIRSGTPTLAFTLPAGISVAQGRITAYRGNAATTPLDASTAVTMAAGTAVSVTGLTTTQDNDLIVAMTAGGQEATWASFTNVTTPLTASGSVTTAAPSTTAWLKRAETVTTTGVDTSLGVFDAVRTGTGATGNLTVTASISAGHVVVAGAFKILPPTADAWNRDDKSASMALSASDKTATCSASTQGIQSTQKYSNETAGKYYAEFKADTVSTTNRYGIQADSASVTAAGSSIIVASGNAGIQIAGAGTGLAVGTAVVSGDVICMAWDAGAERIWFRLNGGLWNGDASANPATGTNGLDISTALGAVSTALWFYAGTTGAVCTIRTEVAEFTQSGPAGFTSWMGEALGPPATNVPLTGAEATAQAGTVFVCIPASGVWDTGTWDCDYWAGTDVAFAVTGSEATGQAGTVTASGVSNVSTLLTGAQVAGQAGTVTASGVRNVSTTLTGAQATGQAGTVSASGVINVSTLLTGSQATGQAGSVTASGIRNASTLLTGVQATVQAGTVTVATATNASTMLTGSEATGQAGTVSVNAVRNVSTLATGAQATGQAGTVTVTAGTGVNAPLTGAQATGQAGTVSITANQAVSFTLTGAQATAQAGGVAVAAGGAISVGVSGAQATGQAGTVGVTANRTVSTTLGGAAATAQSGTVTVNAVRNVSTLATGAQATGQAGTVGITANRSAAIVLTGAQASGQAGGVSILAGGSITVSLSGSQAAGQAGSVTVTTTAAAAGLVKVWTGSAWVDKPAKVWTGSAWMTRPVKHWTGSAWV